MQDRLDTVSLYITSSTNFFIQGGSLDFDGDFGAAGVLTAELELVLSAGLVGNNGNSSAGRFFQLSEPLAVSVL